MHFSKLLDNINFLLKDLDSLNYHLKGFNYPLTINKYLLIIIIIVIKEEVIKNLLNNKKYVNTKFINIIGKVCFIINNLKSINNIPIFLKILFIILVSVIINKSLSIKFPSLS